MTSSSDVMPRLRLIGRNSALCDVILMLILISLAAVFLTRYTEMARMNSISRGDSAASTSQDEEEPPSGKPPLSQQTIIDRLDRIRDSRPPVCHGRKYSQLPMATIVIVFSDYEFYDAKLTLMSMLRDKSELSQLVSEILLVDDASTRQQILQDAHNYVRLVSEQCRALCIYWASCLLAILVPRQGQLSLLSLRGRSVTLRRPTRRQCIARLFVCFPAVYRPVPDCFAW